jgi:glycosyltransferase involved in cell wall biosynthesis
MSRTCAVAKAGKRLGVYLEGAYHQSLPADGPLYVRSELYGFLLFLDAVSLHFEETIVFGRKVSEPHGLTPLPASNLSFRQLPSYGSLRDLGGLVRALPASVLAMWRGLDDIDVMWVLGPNPMSILMAMLAGARGRAVTLGVRQHTMAYFRRRLPRTVWQPLLLPLWGIDLLFRAMARIWGVTAVGPTIARQYGAPRSNVHEMIVSLIKEAEIREGSRVSADLGRVRLLTVGRIEPEKNPFLLIDAMALLQRYQPGRFTLTWVGTGRLAAAVERRAKEVGVEDRISFLGFIPFGEGMLRCYSEADIFVHVALTEGVPQVLMEAAAAQTAIVATDVGGVGAVLADGAGGVLVPPNDARKLTSAVLYVSDDAGARQRFVCNAQAYVREHTVEMESARVAAFLSRFEARPR